MRESKRAKSICVANPTIIGGGHIFICSCSAYLISFEIDCFDGLCTRMYEYAPPPMIELATPLKMSCVVILNFLSKIYKNVLRQLIRQCDVITIAIYILNIVEYREIEAN